MDASLRTRAELLASEITRQAKTAEDLNDLMRLMMKSAMERMLDTEMDEHLGRVPSRKVCGSGIDGSTASGPPWQTFPEPSQWALRQDGQGRPWGCDSVDTSRPGWHL